MKTIMRYLAPPTAAAIACLAIAAQPASAATVTGNGTVTANVQAACNLVSTPTVPFGTVSSVGPLAADIPATGTITVACSNGASYTVYIGDGANRVGVGTGLRQMANGAGRLAYQLYKEVAHTNIWDATGGTAAIGGAGGVNGTGSGANQTLTVFGLIPAGTVVPSVTGAYTDSVVVTVTY
ncbi:MAG: spore coat U domain-containing protein [Pseudomonadota bacterium]